MKNYQDFTDQDIQAFVSKFSNVIVTRVRRLKNTNQFCVTFKSKHTDKGTLWVKRYDDSLALGWSKNANHADMDAGDVGGWIRAFHTMVDAIRKELGISLQDATELVALGELTIVGNDFYGLVEGKDGDGCRAFLYNRTAQRLSVHK